MALKGAILQLHHCGAAHLKTVFVDEKFHGNTMWQGNIELFELKDHPKAKRCFAWLHQGRGDEMQAVVLLEKWPINSPQAAIQFALAFDLPRQTASGYSTHVQTDGNSLPPPPA